MRVAIWFVLISGCLAPLALAQQSSVGTIQTSATATVDAAPDYFDFWIHYHATGKDFAEATKKALDFSDTLSKTLENRNLKTLNISMSGVSIPNIKNPEAFRSARMRFSAAPFKGKDEPVIAFAKLCDALRSLAADLSCTLEGPFPGLNDPKPFEQAAVGQALSESLPLAQGGAASMNAQVLVVDKAKVAEIAWNKNGEWRGALPEIQRMTCTAKVTVSYSFGSQY